MCKVTRSACLVVALVGCAGGPTSYTTETFTVAADEAFAIAYDGHDFSQGEGWSVCCEEGVPSTVTITELGLGDTDPPADGDGFLISGTLPAGEHTLQFGAVCYVDGPTCNRWDFRVTLVAE